MNIKKLLLSIFAVLALSLCAPMAEAQTPLTETTISVAVPPTGNFVTLASVSGVSVGTILFAEDGTSGNASGRSEAMIVVTVPSSGTTVQVIRGYDQTTPVGHISGAPIIFGPASAFGEVEPTGSCTAGSGYFQYVPYINLRTGNQWLCSPITGAVVPGFFNVDAPAGLTTAVASVAGATLPSGPLFHVTGINAITAWGSSTSLGTIGGAGSHTDVIGAPFCVIPDGAFTTTATNNIAKASTAVVNQMMCFTFDQTNKKYVPSY